MKLLLKPWCLLVSIVTWHLSFSQAPAWSSYPSASAVIFIDFDGHTIEGTSWNWTGAPIACDASGLNTTAMQEIFNRVAEDFRPFNINVTTDSTKFLAAPMNQRMRVIVTTTSAWYSNSAGGVSFINSFTWGDDHPCFVFSALLNYNPKKIGEAVSHETGHTLGLYHQSQYDGNCNKITDYHSGQGSGEIGWAPIMGIGYSRNFTLWSNGPNSLGCSTYQSDLDIIASAENGFGFRSDDHGNSIDSATQLVLSNQQFEMEGVIHRNTDRDLFSFNMQGRARLKLDAVPYNVGVGNAGSDLDLQISLYDAAKNLLNIYNPGTLLNSVIDTTLNPGLYYLEVEGKGNANAPAYASLGSYLLTGSVEGDIVLPLLSIRLKGQYRDLWHHFDWSVEADEQLLRQTVEVSINDGTFVALADVPLNETSYSYHVNSSDQYQYRIKTILRDGRIHYSNIISIAPNQIVHKPVIMGNPVKSGTLYVNSPGKLQYQFLDASGKMIRKGILVKGTNNINTMNLTPGIYFIRYHDTNQVWTDKILLQ